MGYCNKATLGAARAKLVQFSSSIFQYYSVTSNPTQVEWQLCWTHSWQINLNGSPGQFRRWILTQEVKSWVARLISCLWLPEHLLVCRVIVVIHQKKINAAPDPSNIVKCHVTAIPPRKSFKKNKKSWNIDVGWNLSRHRCRPGVKPTHVLVDQCHNPERRNEKAIDGCVRWSGYW